jgi:hypothetical protein
MSFIKNLALLLLLSIALVGCSTTNKLETLKPLPSDDSPMVYKSSTSFVSMPLEISLNEIEKQLNKKMSGLIYEDNDMKNDKQEMKIWKTGTIKISVKNGKIETILPLKVWVKFKYGTDFMGLNDTREVNLDGTITLLSDAKMSNFKLTTSSKIADYVWNESPSIAVAGRNVPITYIINPMLSLSKSKISKMIDDAINDLPDFKPMVLEVLENMSKPFITSEAYQTWFRLEPLEVYVTDAALDKSKITMDLGLKCNMLTMVGQEPKNVYDKNTVAFKPVTRIPDKITANIAAISTYESASRIISKNFRGQEFASGSRKIVVNEVMLWQKDGKIIIALAMSGSINGTIYLAGIPNYNPETQEIYFDQMDYVLNTKGLLTRTANWLLQGVILKKIQESCRYSIKGNLDEGKKNMLPYLNNYSPMKGVFVNGTMNDFEFEKVEITNKAIIAFLKTTGKMKVTIDGME